MKKQIVLATAATLLTSSAWATKARMSALSQDEDRGSHFISDSRNVFRNAAHINSMKNYVVTEWGQDTLNTVGSSTAPNAEGGFFKEAGAFAYGVYMGSDITDQGRYNATTNSYVADLGGTSTGTHGHEDFLERSNDLDLFFGGDMGVEWGARLHYAKANQESNTAGGPEAKASNLGLGLGVVAGDLSAHLNYTLSDEMENITSATTQGIKWEDDGSMNIGVAYNWMDFTFYGEYDKKGGEYTGGTGVQKDTTELKTILVGAGYTKEVSSTSRMFTDVSFKKQDAEDKDGATAGAAGTAEASRTALPVVVGFEADATSWLTLRGSIKQNVLINSQKSKVAGAATREVKSTRGNTTEVNAGATLNFGKLKVDGMIGTNGVNGTNTDANNGVLDLDRLMTKVAVHYWF